MRALTSYLTAILILVSLAAAGGAWLPSDGMVPVAIPVGQTPFPFATELESRLPQPMGTTAADLLTSSLSATCVVPEREPVCTAHDFRSVDVVRPVELLVPESVTGVEDWRPLIERFFAPEDVDRALRIVSCESGGDPAAANPISTARGLFQHLGSAWPKRAERAGWGGSDILDPVANTAVAAWLVYEGGGWSHWAASGHCW